MSHVPDASHLPAYFAEYSRAIAQPRVYDTLKGMAADWAKVAEAGGKIIFAGNGGSAAIASHCSVDLTKTARIRAVNFNEADLITCFANDFGYAEWLAKAVEFYGDPGDVLVLISSSGRSPNILAAAAAAARMGLQVTTLSGFDGDNPLRQSGAVSLWVDSHAYNVVEMTHHIWLLAVVDMLAAEPPPGVAAQDGSSAAKRPG